MFAHECTHVHAHAPPPPHTHAVIQIAPFMSGALSFIRMPTRNMRSRGRRAQCAQHGLLLLLHGPVVRDRRCQVPHHQGTLRVPAHRHEQPAVGAEAQRLQAEGFNMGQGEEGSHVQGEGSTSVQLCGVEARSQVKLEIRGDD